MILEDREVVIIYVEKKRSIVIVVEFNIVVPLH